MNQTVPGRINGIDVSSIQAITQDSANKIAASGFKFAYVQSSRYSSTRDLSFGRTVDYFRKAGLRVGAYHFCSHDSDPKAQMEHFYRACGGLGIESGDMPPMIDWEFCTPAVYAPNHPKHCVDWLADALMAAEGLWYCNNDNSIIKRYPVTYTYPNYGAQHQPNLGMEPSIARSPLCYASYKSKPSTSGNGYELVAWIPTETQGPLHELPKPWNKWTLWQYSGDKGLAVPGVSGSCDRQVFNGTKEDFDRFCGIYRNEA